MRNLDKCGEEEKAILEIMRRVERLGASDHLTNTVNHLSHALNHLGNHFDSLEPYWQAELIGKDGNPTGLVLEGLIGRVVCAGEGARFPTAGACSDYIHYNFSSMAKFLRPAEHMNFNKQENTHV